MNLLTSAKSRILSNNYNRHHDAFAYSCPFPGASALSKTKSLVTSAVVRGGATAANISTSNKKNISSNTINTSSNMRKPEKEKTVMCDHILNHRKCPHGSECKFAHSKEELRIETYRTASLWGLCPDTYRSRPCLDFVSTGKCPYGEKCNGIHDPRLAFLTAEEEKLKKIKSIQFCAAHATTDVNVDYLRISKIAEVNYGPFGRDTASMFASFEAFKDYVCCGAGGTSSSTTTAISTMTSSTSSSTTPASTSASRTTIKEVQRLQIALSFYKSRTFECFRFKASHKVYDKFACMLVQKKFFYLYTTSANVDDVQEINENEYRRRKVMGKHVVVVHELAFDQEATQCGSNYNSSSKPAPALWFNIAESDIQVATVKEITDIARAEKDLKRKGDKKKNFFSAYWSRSLNPEAPFKMIYARLNDPASVHNLIIDVLMYQADTLQGNHNSNSSLKLLQERFEGAKRSIQIDLWPPVCEESMIASSCSGGGRSPDEEMRSSGPGTTERTRTRNRTYDDFVPKVERRYNVSETNNKHFLFLSLCCIIGEGKGKGTEVMDHKNVTTNGRPRLSAFVKIHEAEEGGKRNRKEEEENHELYCEMQRPRLGRIEFVEKLDNPDLPSEWQQVLALEEDYY